jgi:ubiquinone/menaquinone biosynthesis C-methylase UbiE
MPLSRVETDIPGAYQLDALLRGWPLQRAWHRARLDLAACVLPPVRDSVSLDLAAGAGIMTWKFRESRMVSVDMRVDACRAVRSHTPGARAVVAELGLLPFPSGTFSRIYFLETLEHLTLDEGRRVLEEARRVSRPGGRCLITTPNYRSHWVMFEWLLDRLRLTPPLTKGQHVSRYDSEVLECAAATTGWRILRLGSFNLVAPFAGLVSGTIGAWAVGVEVRGAGHAGALLYAVCEATR